MAGLFVTGTDTDVGKTWISYGLMHVLGGLGHQVVGMKPVASGCRQTSKGLRNEDALLLQQASSVSAEYAMVNPYSFEPAIAPEAAAKLTETVIDRAIITSCFSHLNDLADQVVVEGVGGWRVPLHGQYDVAAMAADIGLPVVLVVGLRLGCINHARLTAEAIIGSGLTLVGWVANSISASAGDQQTVETLAELLPAPCLGVVPKLKSPIEVSGYLSIPIGLDLV